MERAVVSHRRQGAGVWRMVVNVMCMLIIAVGLAINVSDLFGYLMKPGEYPIGAEAAGLRYASRWHFLGATIGATMLYVAGLTIPVFTKNPSRKTAFRLAVASWAVIATAWFVFTGE